MTRQVAHAVVIVVNHRSAGQQEFLDGGSRLSVVLVQGGDNAKYERKSKNSNEEETVHAVDIGSVSGLCIPSENLRGTEVNKNNFIL